MRIAFKFMKDYNLDDMATKLVLTGVDYSAGKTNKNFIEQVKISLKKFKGRSVITNADERKAVKVDDTLISEMEQVLLAKERKKKVQK